MADVPHKRCMNQEIFNALPKYYDYTRSVGNSSYLKGTIMMKRSLKYFGNVIVILFSLQAFAEDTIKVTVSATDKTAAALGFTVDGKKSGGPGASYSGEGPKNKEYHFGYRKDNVKGPNIPCGSLTLTENSNVTLTTDGEKCHCVADKEQ